MLSETILELVDSLRNDSVPKHVRVTLEPEDALAFFTFASSYWRWSSGTSKDLN